MACRMFSGFSTLTSFLHCFHFYALKNSNNVHLPSLRKENGQRLLKTAAVILSLRRDPNKFRLFLAFPLCSANSEMFTAWFWQDIVFKANLKGLMLHFYSRIPFRKGKNTIKKYRYPACVSESASTALIFESCWPHFLESITNTLTGDQPWVIPLRNRMVSVYRTSHQPSPLTMKFIRQHGQWHSAAKYWSPCQQSWIAWKCHRAKFMLIRCRFKSLGWHVLITQVAPWWWSQPLKIRLAKPFKTWYYFVG